MRVLAAADVHGKRPVYEWLLREGRQHRVDALILAGDLLGCPDGFDTPEAAQQHDAVGLAHLLGDADWPVLYVMGNDDLVELAQASGHVQSLHGRRLERGRFAFVGYQYSPPFMGGIFEKPETQIATDLARLAPLLGANTVFVSHSPAFGILDPGIGQAHIGTESLARLLADAPCLVHIHGHSHEGFGRDGRHFNVASAGRLRAMLIDLATLEHRVLAADHS